MADPDEAMPMNDVLRKGRSTVSRPLPDTTAKMNRMLRSAGGRAVDDVEPDEPDGEDAA